MDQPSVPTNGARDEDEIHLRDVWNLLVRNWWVIGLSLLLTVGVTAAYTSYMVPVYESVTTIRIEEQSTDLPVLDILQTLSKGSEVETEMEVVRSRTLAEDVVDSLGLQIQIVSPRGVARAELIRSVFVERWAPEGVYVLSRQDDGTFGITNQEDDSGLGPVSATVAAALPGATFTLQEGASAYDEIVIEISSFERSVLNLQESVAVSRPNREASIITVRYASADTQLVHQVPNALARRFIARGQEVRKTEARSTVSFLLEQIDTLSGQLAQAEEADRKSVVYGKSVDLRGGRLI